MSGKKRMKQGTLNGRVVKKEKAPTFMPDRILFAMTQHVVCSAAVSSFDVIETIERQERGLGFPIAAAWWEICGLPGRCT